MLAVVIFAAQAGCGFNITPESAPPQIVGPEHIVSRVRVISQPDSPVAVVGADFGEFVLNVGGGGFTSSGPLGLTIKNISDQTLQRVTLNLSVQAKNGSAGLGLTTKRALAPGQTVRVQGRSGGGQGTAPGGDVIVALTVEYVETADRRYKPSQTWPLPR